MEPTNDPIPTNDVTPLLVPATPGTSFSPNPPTAPITPEVNSAVSSSPTPVSATAAPTEPTPAVALTPAEATSVPPTVAPPVKKRSRKLAVAGLASMLVIGLLGAGYYFGYYTNSSFVYSQSLANSGKGLTALTHEFTAKSKVAAQGYTGSGQYKVVMGDTTTDGKLSFKADKTNSESTFDIGLGANRVNVTLRTIKSTGTSPDLYIKAAGLAGLDSMTGTDGLGSTLQKYNDKWIVVDHTLLDNAAQQATATSTMMLPTSDQIMDEVNAAADVNQQYLFSTKADKAVTKVIKTYGLETVDGHRVIHYTVGLNKVNLKKYITAQNEALNRSKLADWIKQNKLTDKVDSSYQAALKSVDDVKTTDTFEMYSDINSRLVYKYRFAEDKNPATNYVDVGLDYKNKQSLPFFVNGVSADSSGKTNFNLKVTTQTDTKAVAVDLKVTGTNASKYTVTTSFSFQPVATAPAIATPTGAVQLGEVLQQLGISDPMALFGGGATSGTTSGLPANKQAIDSKRRVDIQSLQVQLESYFSDNDKYPTLAQLNDAKWRKTNLPNLDPTALMDPEATAAVLASTPASKVYAYQPTTSAGQACTNVGAASCAHYTLSATLSNGQLFTKKDLN
ncbi:MAG: hypothetical protein QFB87_02485 [Patescibacteria group bacterium]|nr:hypothetical protein [Patescibacteria group bacterium]